MKSLYVFHRIFHYLKVWDFIIALALVAAGGFLFASQYAATFAEDFAEVSELSQEEVLISALGTLNLLCLVAVALIGLGIFHFALSHIFREAYARVSKNVAEEEVCECCCCKEEPASDLDAQVEEVMRWKNLYVEGIITEREFIDKRNEILRISK